MNRLAVLTLLLPAVLLSYGCAQRTVSDAYNARGSGTAKVYNKPYDVVWNTVVLQVRSFGFQVVEESKDRGTLLVKAGARGFSWGENVAVFVEEAGSKDHTRVEVVNKRVVAPAKGRRSNSGTILLAGDGLAITLDFGDAVSRARYGALELTCENESTRRQQHECS